MWTPCCRFAAVAVIELAAEYALETHMPEATLSPEEVRQLYDDGRLIAGCWELWRGLVMPALAERDALPMMSRRAYYAGVWAMLQLLVDMPEDARAQVIAKLQAELAGWIAAGAISRGYYETGVLVPSTTIPPSGT
jgi:hypothetical protein